MDRVMSRTSYGMIMASVKFVRKLANRLEGDRLSVWVKEKDVTEHYGPEVGFVRATIALRQLTRMPFRFESGGQYRNRPLILLVDCNMEKRTMQVFFSKESRDMLQEVTSSWRLRMVPGGE